MCLEIIPSVKRHFSFAEITNSPSSWGWTDETSCLYSQFLGMFSIFLSKVKVLPFHTAVTAVAKDFRCKELRLLRIHCQKSGGNKNWNLQFLLRTTVVKDRCCQGLLLLRTAVVCYWCFCKGLPLLRIAVVKDWIGFVEFFSQIVKQSSVDSLAVI